MEVIGLQIFVSLMLVVGSILLFAFSTKERDHEHGDRLALLPLEKDSNARGAHAPEAEVTRNGHETH
ncbi:putative cytochrome oxidase maturation protein, cbb3-type [Minicystis rosea]|nr:putative cytochrome oxidase maturation protein, cbb3-type [Minicystis rosea]